MDYTLPCSLPAEIAKAGDQQLLVRIGLSVYTRAMSSCPYSTWLDIDLGAIRHNVRLLHTITDRPVMAVIKANAYGHGLVEVGRAAAEAEAAWLAVARLEEAVMLRQAGLSIPVLVLGFTAPERVPEAVAYNISLTAHDPELARAFAEQALGLDQPLRVHAKFDSGMGRLGVYPEDGLPFIRQLKESGSLLLEGMFTHMARADEPELDTTDWQLDRFTELVKAAEANGLRPRWVHAANSASTIYFPRAYFDMVRPGIAVYGLQPSDEAPLPPDFRPALTWKARIASIKTMQPGQGIGYNYRYTTRASERIAVAPVGYADGLRRRLGNFALVGGRRVPVVGGMCMDQCMLRIDEVPEAQVGDEIVLLGKQGDASITAEELGHAWGSNNYEVVCGLTARVPRIYRD